MSDDIFEFSDSKVYRKGWVEEGDHGYVEMSEEEILAQPCVVEALREAEDALVEALKALRAVVDGSVHQRAGFRLVPYTVIDEAHRVLGDAPCGRCGDYHNDGVCPEE
jgi:hypothetical protein